ncbi:MAG: hypothetical protein ACYTEQ_24530 [Planctomycetota bacterium]|jgi:hypothetical protein
MKSLLKDLLEVFRVSMKVMIQCAMLACVIGMLGEYHMIFYWAIGFAAVALFCAFMAWVWED